MIFRNTACLLFLFISICYKCGNMYCLKKKLDIKNLGKLTNDYFLSKKIFHFICLFRKSLYLCKRKQNKII